MDQIFPAMSPPQETVSKDRFHPHQVDQTHLGVFQVHPYEEISKL